MRTALVLAVVAASPPCRTERVNVCGGLDTPDTVVVARHDLMPGKTVLPEDLTMIDLPPGRKDDAAFTHSDQAVGRVPTERILAFEALREARFAPPEAGVGLNAVVAAGEVAVRIPLGVAEIQPGNHVDLLITSGTRTRRWLDGQPIVAVLDSPEPVGIVSLPRPRAEEVQQALAVGAPTVVLRSDADFPHPPAPWADWMFGALDVSAARLSPAPR